MNQIEEISAPPLPFDPNEKIFSWGAFDDEDENNVQHEKHSFNDIIQHISDVCSLALTIAFIIIWRWPR